MQGTYPCLQSHRHVINLARDKQPDLKDASAVEIPNNARHSSPNFHQDDVVASFVAFWKTECQTQYNREDSLIRLALLEVGIIEGTFYADANVLPDFRHFFI